jgi:integrase
MNARRGFWKVSQAASLPSTVNRYLRVLSRILSTAYENGIVDSNPMSRVNRLREPGPRRRYLNQFSDDEGERLMKALAGYGEHVVAHVELGLEAGTRLAELLNARWAESLSLTRSALEGSAVS